MFAFIKRPPAASLRWDGSLPTLNEQHRSGVAQVISGRFSRILTRFSANLGIFAGKPLSALQDRGMLGVTLMNEQKLKESSKRMSSLAGRHSPFLAYQAREMCPTRCDSKNRT